MQLAALIWGDSISKKIVITWMANITKMTRMTRIRRKRSV